MSTDYWKSGDWNAICDVCGFCFKASQLKKRWDGYMVCSEDWEIRHPQELIRPIKDMQKLPWTRPVGTEKFITGLGQFVCSAVSQAGVADVGAADCARADQGVIP